MADDLFTHAERRAEANAAKRAGMQQSEDNADEAWSRLMLQLVERVCRLFDQFNADDVFDMYDKEPSPPRTHDPRAFGPVMMRAAKLGWCERTNTVTQSRRKSSHARPLTNWRSLLR
jgi:hypothetical protein